jgi:hypothetical protein
MLFILHATMHLMNHYEIPAFEQGIITARNPRVGLIDLEALARAEEAAAAMLYTPQSNGAVFRRMQALRRAAQLAEEAGLDTPQRRGRGRNGTCFCMEFDFAVYVARAAAYCNQVEPWFCFWLVLLSSI